MTEVPKRPLSAYFLWLSENREGIKRSNPGMKVTEVAKRGGELWRGLTDKTKWEKKAVEAKEEYTRQMKEFEANGGNAGGGKKRSRSSKSKPVKKEKKMADSEDDDDDDEEESD